MRSLAITVTATVTAAVLLVAGCGPVPGPDVPTDDDILTDDLDLDSYHAEGSIDGLTWVVELCALNLIPVWQAEYVGGRPSGDRMLFEAYDSDIDAGVVKGGWLYPGKGDHGVQITKGTFTVATAASAQEVGTIAVELQATEGLPAPGGSIERVITGALSLTPVVKSPACTVTDTPEYLSEALTTYAGPGGG